MGDEANEVQGWEVLARTVWIDDPWIRVRTDRCRSADGRIIDPFHVIDLPDWATVVGLTGDLELLMVRVYRHPFGRILLEFPAGGIDPGETPEAAAARELREETGHAAAGLVPLPAMYPSTGRTAGIAYPFFAPLVEAVGAPELEPAEELEVVSCDMIELLEGMHGAEAPIPGVHLAALHCAALRILAGTEERLKPLKARLKAFYRV